MYNGLDKKVRKDIKIQLKSAPNLYDPRRLISRKKLKMILPVNNTLKRRKNAIDLLFVVYHNKKRKETNRDYLIVTSLKITHFWKNIKYKLYDSKQLPD